MSPRNEISKAAASLLICLGMIWSGLAHATYAILASGPYAYITNYNSNTVSVVDTASSSVLAEIPVGGGPYGVAVHPNGKKAYITNYAGQSVSVIDAVNNVVSSTISLPRPSGVARPYGIDISPDGAHVYVATYPDNCLYVIDTSTEHIAATIAVGSAPRAVLVSHDGKQIYVANFSADSVSVIDAATNAVTSTIALSSSTGPIGLTLTPDDHTLYVTGYSSNQVHVIDAKSDSVTAAIPVGTRPWGIAVTPDGKTIYVGNYSGNVSATTSISVIDASTNAVSASIALPAKVFPSGLAVHPDGTRVYVASYSTGVVYVLDTATHTIQSTTQVGRRPYAFGNFIALPQPGVSLSSPADKSLLNDPYPLISLELFGQCLFDRCMVDQTFLATYQLTATLNGKPVSAEFVADDPYYGAWSGLYTNFSPLIPLPEGTNTLSFQVTDRYGHSTPMQTASFTIDTIAPQFLSISPPDGATVLDANITLSGGVDDPHADVSVDFAHLVSGASSSQPGPNFAFPLNLNPGANRVDLLALDPAGNRTTASLHFTYTPFTLSITSPLNGDMISTDRTTVSGSFSGANAATVSVNGVTASINGTSFSAANVPVAPGYNLLVARGTRTADGKVATQSITVTGPATLSIDSPADNATLNATTTIVSGTVLGMSTPAITVNGVAASLSGNDYSATVPLAYGSNALTAIASEGNQTLTKAVTVTRRAALSVVSPANGATLVTDTATVTGKTLGMSTPLVSVNGVTASVNGNNFSATVPLTYGGNSLTVTASEGDEFATQTLNVTCESPTLTVSNIAYNGDSAIISGNYQGPMGTTVTLNGIAATLDGANFSAQVPLKYGPNAIQIVATTPAGGTATHILTLTSTVPTVSISSPAAGATITNDRVTVTGTVDGPDGTTVSVNGVAASVSGNGFTTTNVPVGYGKVTLTATTTAPDGSSATSAVNVTGTATVLEITEPPDGSSINGDTILVSGRFQGPPNSGVTVNGVLANIDNGRFYANNVSLVSGANTLTATYTTQDGATDSKTVNVSSTGSNPIQVTATEYVGLAPMSLTLQVVDASGDENISVGVEPGGNGSAGAGTVDGNTATFPVTYTTPGTYTPTVIVTDSTGTHTQTLTLVVHDPSAIDSLLRNIYGDMLARLKVGDIDRALAAVTGGVYDKYKDVFTTLRPGLSDAVDQIGVLQTGALNSEMAEYSVLRSSGDSAETFFIYFIRGDDGVWRIDGM